jgi:hypothetical protein
MEGAVRDAVNGGMGGMVATALAYPLIIAKVKLQAQSRGARGGKATDADAGTDVASADYDSDGGNDLDGIDKATRATTSSSHVDAAYTSTFDTMCKVARSEGLTGLYVFLPLSPLFSFFSRAFHFSFVCSLFTLLR